MFKVMSREEFQKTFVDADADFFEFLTDEHKNERYLKILEREYLKYVDEQVRRRILSIEC